MGDVETPGGQRTTVKPSAKTDKAEEEDKQDKAASPEAAKEGSASSSDDEEWTVLSDEKPEAEVVQIPIQVLDKEVAPVYPTLPAEESTSSSSTPRNTTTSAAQAAQAAEEAFAAAGMPEGSGEEYLHRVGDFVAAALDPPGIDVQVDVETPGGQRTTVKPSAKTDKAE